MPDFVRDVVGANGPVELVTVEEREALGYQRPQDVDNPAVQRLALANREAIEAEVREQVGRALGRPVEVTNMDATFPYRALSVSCVTLDEPRIGVSTVVSLRADGRVKWVDTASMGEAHRTVGRLYLLAFPERTAAMRAYLAEAWPQFTGLPEGYARRFGEVDPDLDVQFGAVLGTYGEVSAWYQGIYEQFRAEPDRPVEEWRAMFEAAPEGLVLDLLVDLVARDAATELSRELALEIADGMRADPAFAQVGSWSIFVRDALMPSRGTRFHHEFWVQADPMSGVWPDWIVSESKDGYTQ